MKCVIKRSRCKWKADFHIRVFLMLWLYYYKTYHRFRFAYNMVMSFLITNCSYKVSVYPDLSCTSKAILVEIKCLQLYYSAIYTKINKTIIDLQNNHKTQDEVSRFWRRKADKLEQENLELKEKVKKLESQLAALQVCTFYITFCKAL